MSHYSSGICSDEELLEELRKLGYDDVPSDIFDSMKGDLVDLLEKEQSRSPILKHIPYSDYSDHLCVSDRESTSNAYMSRKTKKKSQNGTSTSVKVLKDKLLRSENIRCDDLVKSPDFRNTMNDSLKKVKSKSSVSPIDYTFDCNEDRNYVPCNRSSDSKVDFNGMKLKTGSPFVSNENCYQSNSFSNSNKSNKITLSKRGPKTARDISSIADADSHETYNLHSVQNLSNSSDKSSNSSFNPSTSSEKKTMKRKVLRRRNGQSIITEEIVEAPTLFDTSYPESESFNNSKSFSSDDLSCKSNNYTGTVSGVNSVSLKSSPSTHSLGSLRSSSLRINPRKKKSDPVSMYCYYKKFWDNFKPPGEKSHDKLRWAIRDRMLEYNV